MKRMHLILLSVLLLFGCAGNGKRTAELEFHTFDGGGPKFTMTIDDPEIISVKTRDRYSNPFHSCSHETGAGHNVIFTLKAERQGETTVTVTEYFPIADSYTFHTYRASVDGQRRLTVQWIDSVKAEKDE